MNEKDKLYKTIRYILLFGVSCFVLYVSFLILLYLILLTS